MKEIKIQSNEAGQRLDKFLHKLLKEASTSFLYKMMRKKNIVLNGKKASGSEKLEEGDVIRLFLSDETYAKFAGEPQDFADYDHLPNQNLEILYEDEDVLFLNKPAGMLSQKAKKEDVSANEYALQYLLKNDTITKESLHTFKPSVCNRLDRNTSGILIVGKTLKGSQTMSHALKERSIQKYYLCLVAGVLSPKEMERNVTGSDDNENDNDKVNKDKSIYRIEGYLRKDERNNQVQILQNPKKNAKPIVTEYRPIRRIGNHTLLEVHLITGRSHQIRAHLASIGHPIIGDTKYGDAKINREYAKKAGITHQLLHAHRLVLEDGREILVELPEEFNRAMGVMKG